MSLTFRQEDLWLRFEAWLRIYKKETFSSDDFREFGLHRILRDPAHEIGAIFFVKQEQGIIELVGRAQSRIPSNHKREIKLFKLKT